MVFVELVTATWSEWVSGECTSSCGEGYVTSFRHCKGVGYCDGEEKKIETCNPGSCGKHYDYICRIN